MDIPDDILFDNKVILDLTDLGALIPYPLYSTIRDCPTSIPDLTYIRIIQIIVVDSGCASGDEFPGEDLECVIFD